MSLRSSSSGTGAATRGTLDGSGAVTAEPIRVLVADDHVLYRRGLQFVLGQEDDIDIGLESLELVEERFAPRRHHAEAGHTVAL